MALSASDPLVQAYGRAMLSTKPVAAQVTRTSADGTTTASGAMPSSGFFVDPSGNYFEVNGGTVTNVGWDRIAQLGGMGAAQKVSAATAASWQGAVGAQGNQINVATGQPTQAAQPAQADPNDPFGAPGITDPTFKVVQRGYQLENDTLGQNAAMDRADAQAKLDFYLPEIGYQGELARRGIANDAEGRGILRSGEYARNVAEQQHAEAQSVGQAQMEYTQQAGSIERGLATQQAQLRRQYAEQLAQAGNRQYLQTGVAPYQ